MFRPQQLLSNGQQNYKLTRVGKEAGACLRVSRFRCRCRWSRRRCRGPQGRRRRPPWARCGTARRPRRTAGTSAPAPARPWSARTSRTPARTEAASAPGGGGATRRKGAGTRGRRRRAAPGTPSSPVAAGSVRWSEERGGRFCSGWVSVIQWGSGSG
jgi:hypothetical protein